MHGRNRISDRLTDQCDTSHDFSSPYFDLSGAVARITHAVDMKIRTIPVELDVASPKGRLASGIFPEVVWPGRSEDDSVCSGIVGRRDHRGDLCGLHPRGDVRVGEAKSTES